MFFPMLAAIISSVGVIGFVVSSLAYTTAAGDFIFNAAAVCMVVGPLVFFVYVIIGLCVEFVTTNQKSEVRITPSPARPVVAVSNIVLEQWIPEGLRRERKGPLNLGIGRGLSG